MTQNTRGGQSGSRHRKRKKKCWTVRRIRRLIIGILAWIIFIAVLAAIVTGAVFGIRALVKIAKKNSITTEIPENEEEKIPDQDIQEQETPDQDISIIMAGDMLLHTDILESGLQDDGTYNYDHLFTHTRDLISSTDLALVNEEVILGGSELGLSGYPEFNAGYEVGDALVNAGFNVICHANNHALDMGETGLLNCLNFWRTSYPDVHVLGIHDSEEDRNTLCYIEEKGITIAVLNYTYGINQESSPHSYSVDMLDETQVTADLAEAGENADFIIVVPHWGTEYETTPSDYEEEWAQLFLENGVDLVLGAHPHVIQPVEWLSDDEGHRMLVYYSLGNYISFTEGSGVGKGERAVGAMATVTLTVSDGEVSISDYGVIPIVSQLVSGTGNPTVYPLSEYTDELASESEMSEKDPAFSLEYCKDLCREIFGDLYQE